LFIYKIRGSNKGHI